MFVMIMIPLSWKLIVTLFRLVSLPDADRNRFIRSFAAKKRLDVREKKNVCNALMDHGLSDYITTHLGALSMNPVIFIIAAVICIYILILLVPIAPSLTNIVTPIVLMFATQVGVSPAFMIPIWAWNPQRNGTSANEKDEKTNEGTDAPSFVFMFYSASDIDISADALYNLSKEKSVHTVRMKYI